ncbi:MAG TPA: extracellular solute-binding protein [Chloroflexota bacterium]|nr:extracellular solute-binding protein [Chloroflexota bacterium]
MHTTRAGMTRRQAMAQVAMGAGSALLMACRSGQERQAADGRLALSQAPVTVVSFLSGITTDLMGAWEETVVAPYRERRPNVRLELIPQTGPTIERIEKLSALMAAGTPPDLGDGPQSPRVMVPQGMLDEALDALVKRDKYDTGRYNQAHLEQGNTFEGKIWAMPYRYGGNALGMACNTSLFAEAGVALPPGEVDQAWTWEQFVTALTRLTRSIGGQVSQFGLAGPAWIVGTWSPLWKTDWLDEKMQAVICDNPQMQDCYTRLHDLFHRYHVLPQLGEAARLFGNANLFNTGKAAILLFPPTGWRTYGINAQVDYSFAPMPKVVVTTPDMGMGGISLYKAGQHPADSWEVIKHLIEGSRYARLIGLMPAPVADIEPWLKEQLRAVPSADPKVVLRIVERAGSGGTRMSQHPRYSDMQAVINPAMDDFMAGKVAPQTLLQGLKPQLQAILDGRS